MSSFFTDTNISIFPNSRLSFKARYSITYDSVTTKFYSLHLQFLVVSVSTFTITLKSLFNDLLLHILTPIANLQSIIVTSVSLSISLFALSTDRVIRQRIPISIRGTNRHILF